MPFAAEIKLTAVESCELDIKGKGILTFKFANFRCERDN